MGTQWSNGHEDDIKQAGSSLLFLCHSASPSNSETYNHHRGLCQEQTNGLINDVKEINLFLNIPTGCDIVYDGLIKQLEGCRSGSNHGDPRLTSGCCSSSTSLTSSRIAPTLPSSSPLSKPNLHPPRFPCNGTYC